MNANDTSANFRIEYTNPEPGRARVRLQELRPEQGARTVVQRVVNKRVDSWILLHDLRALLAPEYPTREIDKIARLLYDRLRDLGAITTKTWLPNFSIGEAVRYGDIVESGHTDLHVLGNDHLLNDGLRGWEREVLLPVVTDLVTRLVEEINGDA